MSKDEKKRMAIIIGAFAGALLLIFLIFTLIFNGFGGGGGKTGGTAAVGEKRGSSCHSIADRYVLSAMAGHQKTQA